MIKKIFFYITRWVDRLNNPTSLPKVFSYEDFQKREAGADMKRQYDEYNPGCKDDLDVQSFVKYLVEKASEPGAIKRDVKNRCDWSNSEQFIFAHRLKDPKRFGSARTLAYWKVRGEIQQYFPGWDVVLLRQNAWERYRSKNNSYIEIIFVKHLGK